MTSAYPLPASARARQRGFSIIELMISVVIGMLAIMFATRLIVGGEQNKQTAMGGSDAMQNGMLAMFSLSNDASQAGYGLNDPLLVGCDTVFADKNAYTLASATRSGATIHPLAAAIITNNPAGSDEISLYSGSSLMGTGTVRLLKDYTGEAFLTVDHAAYGFKAKDVIVVAPEKGATQCSLAQVSVDPNLSDATPTLRIDTGADVRFNTGKLNALFGANAARAFNLGQGDKLSFHTWSVADNFLRLRATDMAGSGTKAAVIADNIIALKAQYGFDTRVGTAFTPDLGTQVSQWSSTMIDADGDGVAGSPGDYQRIVALRLAVVARSKSPERAPPGGTCNATAAPTLTVFNNQEPSNVTPVSVTVNLAVAGDTVSSQCYHYRAFETIVPIRNSAWRP